MRLFSRSHRMLRQLFAAAVLAVFVTGTGHAAQILVSEPVDAVRSGDGCSLREAIINANMNSKQGSAECARGSVGEVDVIVLPPETIPINSMVDVTDDLVILGGSGSWTILDARYRTRILNVSPDTSLTIRGVKLHRGYAVDEGAALRVQGNGRLDAEYLVATSSRIDSATANGRGAGIFLAGGAVANISRSEISLNEALGTNAVGAGIYCAAGCGLTLSSTVVTGNKAGLAAGGLWVAGDATLDFSTVAMNQAPSAAGMLLSGPLTVFASIFADNGSGGVGADVDCDGLSPIQAKKTFIEMPGVDCAQADSIDPAYPIPGVDARSNLPSGLQANVLYATGRSPYEGAPVKSHQITESYSAYLRSRISAVVGDADYDARCVGLVDHHGRERAAYDSVANNRKYADCDLGAFQAPMLSIWTMGLTVYASEAGKQLFVILADPPAVDTRVRVYPVGGVGEDCSGFETFVTFDAGVRQTLASVFIDPSAVFALPGLNRKSRVCELAAEIVAEIPEVGKSPLGLVGATAGNIRVKVVGNPASTAQLSSPEPGYYLDFAKVPVGAGGLRSLLMTPDLATTGAISITQVKFRGDDKAQFEIVSPAAVEAPPGSGIFVLDTPLVVLDRTAGGSAVQVRCRPGKLGDFDAEMVVSTDSLVYQDLVYGVSCSETHYLSFTTLGTRISEEDGPTVQAVVALDSPCVFAVVVPGQCLELDFQEAAGSAASGVDYGSFGGPIIFAPGETQKVIDLQIIDDTLVEGEETFGVRVVPPSGKPGLYMPGDQQVWVRIEDNDQPSREIKAFLMNLPAHADPGELLPFVVAVHNRSTSPLTGVRVEVAVAQPMLLRSFALQGASCTLSSTKRRATCQFGSGFALAANMKPLGVSEDDDEAVESRKNDADWVRVYGQLVTANMVTPPVMDIQGAVSASARAGDPAADGAVTHSLTIDAPPLSSLGGALWLHWMLLLLLPFRRQLQETTGRKADWFRR